MAHIVQDRIKVTSISTGTGPMALLDAVTGFDAFIDVCANNDTAFYCIKLAGQWEVGKGTWTSDNLLYRNLGVLNSSNADALVDFSTGSKEVFIVDPAFMHAAMTGDMTKPVDSNVTTIAANAVTNAKLAKMAALTVKGNFTGGLADPTDGSALTLRAMLAVSPTIASIAALRLLDGTFTEAVANVQAYYSGGLDGGGYFMRDGTVGGPDNAGTTILDAANRNWKRLDAETPCFLDFGARGDGTTDDTTAMQATIDAAEVLAAAGAANVIIDGAGRFYRWSNELTHDSGINVTFQNFSGKPLASANWSASPYTANDLPNVVRTNIVLWCRDLTNAAWVKTTMTAALTATGIDGVVNSATKLTATAGNATVLQSPTSAAATRIQTAFIRRVTGAGNIDMTMDNGATWTTLSPAPDATFRQYKIPVQTLANPIVGFRIVTNGDEIEVDFVQNESFPVGFVQNVSRGPEFPISSPPILTTSAAATRFVSSKYMLKLLSPASTPHVRNVYLDCDNLCGGIYFAAFGANIDHVRMDNNGGCGIRQEQGGCRITNNLISQSFIPSGRTGVGIYLGSPDSKVLGNISRYSAAPIYLGFGVETASDRGSTALIENNHFYNGHSSRPDSISVFIQTTMADTIGQTTFGPPPAENTNGAPNSNLFVGNYFDSGKIAVGNFNNGFWANRCAWSAATVSASALFVLWTDTTNDTPDRFNFGGLVYPKSSFAAVPSTLFEFISSGAGSWQINEAVIEALDASAIFAPDLPTWVSNQSDLGAMIGQGATAYLNLYARGTTTPPAIGVSANTFFIKAGGSNRFNVDENGLWYRNGLLWDEKLKLTTETRTATTTLTDDATLQFNYVANQSYRVDIDVLVSTVAAADFKFDLNVTAGTPTLQAHIEAISADATTIINVMNTAFNTVHQVIQATGLVQHIRISMILYADGNAGTFSFRWAQVTSDAGNTSVRMGSYMTVRRID
jgi:hypothetical protein